MGAFRADRVLLGVFALLSLTAIFPLFLTPFVPAADLPGNVMGASLVARVATGDAAARAFYEITWWPTPYWTVYALQGALGLVVGPLLATKVIVAGLVVLLPLAVLRVLLALGRDPRLATWAFLLSWDHNLLSGWHSFLFGMSAALFFVAALLETTDTRGAWKTSRWSWLIALSHPQAIAFALIAAIAVSLRGVPVVRRLRLAVIACSGMFVTVALWLARRPADPLGPKRFRMDYPPVSEKIARLFSFALDDLVGAWPEAIAALAFLVLVLGVLGLTSLPRRALPSASRHAGALLVLAPLALYVAAPMSMRGPIQHHYTYPRYATFLLLSLLFVPAPRLDGTRALFLVPGVVVALALHLSVARALFAFGARTRPFLEVIAAVPVGTRLAPLEFVDADPAVKSAPLQHMHSYVTAVKRTYDPHLYDEPSAPIHYRPGGLIPRVPWIGPQEFSLARYAAHYDYVLVQGLEKDPMIADAPPSGVRVRRVLEAGLWRLYALERE